MGEKIEVLAKADGTIVGACAGASGEDDQGEEVRAMIVPGEGQFTAEVPLPEEFARIDPEELWTELRSNYRLQADAGELARRDERAAD